MISTSGTKHFIGKKTKRKTKTKTEASGKRSRLWEVVPSVARPRGRSERTNWRGRSAAGDTDKTAEGCGGGRGGLGGALNDAERNLKIMSRMTATLCLVQ